MVGHRQKPLSGRDPDYMTVMLKMCIATEEWNFREFEDRFRFVVFGRRCVASRHVDGSLELAVGKEPVRKSLLKSRGKFSRALKFHWSKRL